MSFLSITDGEPSMSISTTHNISTWSKLQDAAALSFDDPTVGIELLDCDKIVSTIVTGLREGDDEIQLYALGIVWNVLFGKKQPDTISIEQITCDRPGLVDALLHVMYASSSSEILDLASEIIHCLATDEVNTSKLFFHPQFIPLYLKQPDRLIPALWCLTRVSADFGRARAGAAAVASGVAPIRSIIDGGGSNVGAVLQAICEVARTATDSDVRGYAVHTLANISDVSGTAALLVVECRILQVVIDAIKKAGSDVHAWEWAPSPETGSLFFLANVSRDPEVSPILYDAGVPELLLPLALQNCTETLEASACLVFLRCADFLKENILVIHMFHKLLEGTLERQDTKDFRYSTFPLALPLEVFDVLSSIESYCKTALGDWEDTHGLLRRTVFEFADERESGLAGGGGDDFASARLAIGCLWNMRYDVGSDFAGVLRKYVKRVRRERVSVTRYVLNRSLGGGIGREPECSVMQAMALIDWCTTK
jgi:hypothetical protein